MDTPSARLNITLDAEYAEKLASLLSTALDDADPDARSVTEVLDAIPGAWERAQLGREQGQRGDTQPLDAL